MEIIKHHKTKPFTRKNVMDLAKVLRNTSISISSREIVTRAIANYFTREDPFFDRNMFNGLSTGKFEEDPKTQAYSTVKEKQDDPEV